VRGDLLGVERGESRGSGDDVGDHVLDVLCTHRPDVLLKGDQMGGGAVVVRLLDERLGSEQFALGTNPQDGLRCWSSHPS
jgi:hypothetical protein